MAATNGHFKTLGIAEESTYASVSAGAVDASGLTYYSFDCTADLTTLPTENPAGDDVGTRDGMWRRPPRPNALYDTGNSRWGQRGEGTFTITGEVDPKGGGSLAYDNHPLRVILGTRFAEMSDPASASEGVAGSTGANVLTATTASLYTEGALIGHTLSGKFRFAQVTGKTGSAITHSPELNPSGLAITNTVRFMRTLYLPAPGESPAVESFAARFDSGGVRFYAVGCVLESGEFTETEGGMLRFSMTCRSPYVYADHGNAALDAVDFAGQVYAHRFGAPVVISDAAADGSAPHALGAEDLDPVAGSVKVTIEGATTQAGFMAEGVPHKLKPLSTDVVVEMRVDDPSATIANDFEARTHRQWAIGYGPQMAGAGVCFFMPRGHLVQSAANREAPDGGVVLQTIQVRPGKPIGVDASTNAANSPFLIGLGL